ncbi:MAG TPA: hypothetical protein VFF44_06250, partial [Casimicrobiaceae bacterium]|nr:hypothetical protein [Casimicrobiaceae bacterium]
NEAEPLRIVEPLYRSSWHVSNPISKEKIGSNPFDVSISRTGKYGASATANEPDRSCFST